MFWIISFIFSFFCSSAIAGNAVIWSSPYPKVLKPGISFTGSDSTANCTASIPGAIRWNSPNIEWCNGTVWASLNSASAGTVTSVGMTVPTFLSVSGVPVTTSGTAVITLSGSALPVANGGTNLTSTIANQILYSSSANVIAGLGTGASSILVTSASGVPSISNQLPVPLGINVAAGANGVYIKNVGDNNDGNLQLIGSGGTQKTNLYQGNSFFGINFSGNTDYMLTQSTGDLTTIGGTASPETNTGVTVNNANDRIQLSVRSNGTQTNNLQNWVKSDHTVLAAIDQRGGFDSSVVQTTLTATGTAVCSQPFQGTSYKKVVCYLSGYTDTSTQTYTFPIAFSHTPQSYGDSTAVAGATITTTTVKFTVTSDTGFIFLEGF